MGFFDDAPLIDAKHVSTGEEEELSAPPPGYPGPPDDWVIPVVVPWSQVLAKNARACVALSGVRCWPAGLTLSIDVFQRRTVQGASALDALGFGHEWPRTRGALRFGVLYDDGRRATNFDELPSSGHDARPTFWVDGGSGNPFHARHDIYLQPLPSGGPFFLVVEWPDQEIAETRCELDGATVRAAAAEAIDVWPDLIARTCRHGQSDPL